MPTELDLALDKADELTHEVAFAFYRQLIKDSVPVKTASTLTLKRFFQI